MGQCVSLGLFQRALQQSEIVVFFHFLSKREAYAESTQYLGPLIHTQYYRDRENKRIIFCFQTTMNNQKYSSTNFLNFR